MISFRSISLKRKQTLIIMMTSCVALVMACVGFAFYDIMTFRETMGQRLTALAEVLGANSAAALDFYDSEVANEVLSALVAEPHIVDACLYKNGRVFASYHRQHVTEPFPEFKTQVEGYRFERDRLVMFHQVKKQGDVVGAIYLESDLDVLSAGLRQYALIAAMVMLAAILVAFLLSSWLQRFISGPILQLVEATGMVSRKKDYTIRVPNSSRDELGQLIDAFNDMLGQIQERDQVAQHANETLEKRVFERTHELQNQISRVSLLNQIARAVVEGQDLAAIFSVLLRGLEAQLLLEFSSVYLFDPLRDCLVVAAHGPGSIALANTLGEHPGLPVALEPAALSLLLRGESRSWSGIAASHHSIGGRLAAVGLISGAIIPMRAEGKLLGSVVVARKTAKAFAPGELEFMGVVGEQVALAARQAQLHSELQKAYDELRTTQQAAMQQERLRALGQMASGIAHDINNALVPVLLGSDLMLTAPMNLSPQGRRLMEGIKTASKDIANTVSRLKEFYRQRQHTDPVTEIDLNSLANEAIDLTRPRWRDIPQQRGKVVNLCTELKSSLPKFGGNESEIRQALINLILNAVDAMPQGGSLTLRSSLAANHAFPGAQKPVDCVCLEVIDTGVGMDEETRRRCLEPFFSTKGTRGTGLGLAMVYGVMQRHKGRVEIQSEVGRGTTMRLVFPVTAITARVNDNTGDTPAPLAPPMRILCIDDEPMVLEVVAGVLAQLGHQVTPRESGPAGLETFRRALAEKNPFDAIITDLGMPEMDGQAVAAAAKGISPRTPVILLTGWGIFMNSSADKPNHVDCILSKPPSIGDLAAALRTVSTPAAPGIAKN